MSDWNVALIVPPSDPTLQPELLTMTQNLQPSSYVTICLAAQMSALATVQKEQAKKQSELQEQLQALEKKVELRDKQIETLEKEVAKSNDNIKRLEHVGTVRAMHRLRAVAHLQSLNISHGNAQLAFRQRSENLQPDDFECYMAEYTAALSTIVNEQHFSIGAGQMYGQPPTAIAGPSRMPYIGQVQPGMAQPMYNHGGAKHYKAPVRRDWQPYCAPHRNHHPCQTCRDHRFYGSVNVPQYCTLHNRPQPCQQCRRW